MALGVAARRKRADLTPARPGGGFPATARGLGTYHGFTDQSRDYRAPRPVYRPATDRQIDSFLGRASGDRRLDFCGRYVTGDIKLMWTGTRAHWRGLAHCESWDCPRCAKRLADRAAGRLAACIESARELGWCAYFGTLTLAHDAHDSLEKCLHAARAGWAKVRRKLRAMPDVEAVVSAWEITLGRHGWHVHAHAVIWTARELSWDWRWGFEDDETPPLPAWWPVSRPEADWTDIYRQTRLDRTVARLVRDLADLRTSKVERHLADARRRDIRQTEDTLREARARALRTRGHSDLWALWYGMTRAWCDGVAATGMHRPDWRRQDLRRARDKDGEDAAGGLIRYILKTAYELAGGAYKSARTTSLTPRGILDAAATGSEAGRLAWREYREATSGLHRIQGLAQLAKIVVPPPPEFDEPEHVATVAEPAWYSARFLSYDRALVRVCERALVGGPSEARKIIERAGTYAVRQDWREAVAVTLGPVRAMGAGVPLSDLMRTSVGCVAESLCIMYTCRDGPINNHREPGDDHVLGGLAGRLAREIAGRGGFDLRRLVAQSARRASLDGARHDPWVGRAGTLGSELQ